MELALGRRRALRLALAVVAGLARVPGGKAILAGFGNTQPPESARVRVAGVLCAAPAGASVSVAKAGDSLRAMPPLGAGLIEVGPVNRKSAPRLAAALRARTCPAVLRVRGNDAIAVASDLAPLVSAIVLDLDGSDPATLAGLGAVIGRPVLAGVTVRDSGAAPPGFGLVLRDGGVEDVKRLKDRHPEIVVTTSNPSIDLAADLVAAGARAVLATQDGLVAAGPAWFHRATIAILEGAGSLNPDASSTPRLAWLAGVGLGLGMIAGGVGAAAVALGPVLLPYDASYLRLDPSTLGRLNPELIHFLQHDRITLAGTMVALGILYTSLSWSGIRQGRVWARNALLASGVVGFPTLFYFFGFHYVEPVHVALAVVLLPLFVLAVWRRPSLRFELPDRDERPRERHLALIGQLVMVAVGIGFILGGATISYVGLTSVFVPSDLDFMRTSAGSLAGANGRLLGFIAHDRAGFGGALVSTGVAVLLLGAWGWHRGERWVWWTIAAAGLAGFGAAIAIHVWVGYTDFFHLAPVYAGSLLTVISLALARPYFLRRT
jgi:hypothetical protein